MKLLLEPIFSHFGFVLQKCQLSSSTHLPIDKHRFFGSLLLKVVWAVIIVRHSSGRII